MSTLFTLTRPIGKVHMTRNKIIGFAVATSTAVLVVAFQGGAGQASATDAELVASLRKAGEADRTAAPSSDNTPAQVYEKGSKEAAKAWDQYAAQVNSCRTKKAQKAGIATEVSAADSHDGGYVVPVQDLGPMTEKLDGSIEGSPLVKKWWSDIVAPCFKEAEAPQVEGDTDVAGQVAAAKKQYDCLNAAGLEHLHEPTLDNIALFTPEGTSTYFDSAVDPHSRSILTTCGLSG
ncbi:hypothetical protein [Streptomyces sp. NPDC051569]|uniref:hypothetical protein n=1 Tax=Streptomyces sp. NPDC051569 TaxID=3365661 RepID=UPI003799385D